MNERIKELAKQAHEDVIRNTPSFLVTRELYEQKFAELIIDDACRALNPMLREGVDLIKKHFGVEK